MSNLRWGVIAASAALILCVALGIISDVRPFYIFLRALIFTVIFFGIGFGIRMVIHSYFPELLYLEEEPVIHENSQPGERVNITVGSTEYAVPEMYKESDDPEYLGNIEELVSGVFKPRAVAESSPDQFMKPAAREGIDVKREKDYNMEGNSQDAFSMDFEFPSAKPPKSAPPVKQAFTPSFGEDGLGGLPDLDAMATAFSGESRGMAAPVQPANDGFMEPVEIDAQLFDDTAPVSERAVSKTGNKPQQLEGDFDPKDLAQGIRTILTKEK